MQDWRPNALEEIAIYKAAGATIRKRHRPYERLHLLVFQIEYARGLAYQTRGTRSPLAITVPETITKTTATHFGTAPQNRSLKLPDDSSIPDTIVNEFVIILNCCEVKSKEVSCEILTQMELPEALSNYAITRTESNSPHPNAATFELVYKHVEKNENLAPTSHEEMREVLQLYASQDIYRQQDQEFMETYRMLKNEKLVQKGLETWTVNDRRNSANVVAQD
ncbi:hypothetical protein TWF481_002794 [Arthrobotrys musiformis]|uniref:Uncharacterized protein n=1 Tax=Arthrobotrys musiformis TaxID=47236 RepID=A0AAV9VR96_9PEZI